MSFSEEVLAELKREHGTVPEKHQFLVECYTARIFLNLGAQEYATYGFARRLKTLARCIDRVFEILPPERADIPTTEELTDATIHLQTFIFNIFGAIDNLAWIWVLETGLKQKSGSELLPLQIGFRPNNEFVRRSLSNGFRQFLEEMDNWFEYLESFRNALAHRIPLYIPPHVVTERNAEAYREIDARLTEAALCGDIAEYERLTAEQQALMFFRPFMAHAPRMGTVVFHSQLLADFNTVHELGQRLLGELDLALTRNPSSLNRNERDS